MDVRITNAYSLYTVNNSVGSAGAKKVDRVGKIDEKRDVFTLSMHAEDFHLVNKFLAGTPDIREEKIFSIKAKIDNGQYNISAEDVAAKLLSNLVE